MRLVRRITPSAARVPRRLRMRTGDSGGTAMFSTNRRGAWSRTKTNRQPEDA